MSQAKLKINDIKSLKVANSCINLDFCLTEITGRVQIKVLTALPFHFLFQVLYDIY